MNNRRDFRPKSRKRWRFLLNIVIYSVSNERNQPQRKGEKMACTIEVTIEITATCDECGQSEQFNVDNACVDDAAMEYEDHKCERCEEE